MNFYNENDPKAAAWLRQLIVAELIPNGVVDERSIADVRGTDVVGFTQCHFFAGIGGWPEALRLARWPADRDVWTGSCPCQPYSAAGKQLGDADPRNLWPEFYRLIAECCPETVFGEQVASAEVVGSQQEADFLVAVQAGNFARANKLAKRLAASQSFHFNRRWVDGIRADLEGSGYAFGAAILGAHSAGSPHIRQRLFWVAHSGHESARWSTIPGEETPRRTLSQSARHRDSGRLADTSDVRGTEHEQESRQRGGKGPTHSAERDSTCGLGDTASGRLGIDGGTSRSGRHADESIATDGGLEHSDGVGSFQRRQATEDNGHGSAADSAGGSDFWSDCDWLRCLDNKSRRVGKRILWVADGISDIMARSSGACVSEIESGKPKEQEEVNAKADEQRKVQPDDVVRHLSQTLAWGQWQTEIQAGCTMQGLLDSFDEAGLLPKALSEIPKIWRSTSDKKRKHIGRFLCARAVGWQACEVLTVGEEARVMRLRGYGNAIVPAVAAAFIAAFCECTLDVS